MAVPLVPTLDTLSNATPEDRQLFDLITACQSHRIDQQRSAGPALGGQFMTKRDILRVKKALRRLQVAVRQEHKRQQKR
jgi:hypothetical protein